MQRVPSAIITGAGSGIGQATAIALARAGCAVTLAGRGIERLNQTRAECEESGVQAVSAACDVSDPNQVERLIDDHVRYFGGIDVLVNNAGVGEVRPLDTITREDITRAMTVNALSAGWAIARVWRTMTTQRSGCIINIASMAVVDPFPGFFAYAASKAAMAMMAVSAAKEGAAHNIRAFAICPGAVETEMLRASFPAAVIPPSECLQPAEVAKVVLECVQGKHDGDNGRAIPVLSPSAQQWLAQHRQDPGLWLR